MAFELHQGVVGIPGRLHADALPQLLGHTLRLIGQLHREHEGEHLRDALDCERLVDVADHVLGAVHPDEREPEAVRVGVLERFDRGSDLALGGVGTGAVGHLSKHLVEVEFHSASLPVRVMPDSPVVGRGRPDHPGVLNPTSVPRRLPEQVGFQTAIWSALTRLGLRIDRRCGNTSLVVISASGCGLTF